MKKMEKQSTVKKAVEKAAEYMARFELNTSSTFITYQPKLPKEVQDLNKENG